MRRYRRPPRRQGVVYGPPRPLGDSGDGQMFGRLLGPVVIVGAFVLLAGAAWVFVGRGAPSAPSPTPTEAAALSPTPAASPSASPSPSPLPSPTSTPTLPATPSPTAFAVEVREGPGAITFGTAYDNDTLRIVDPRTTFPLRGRFYWSAQLTEAAGAPELRITINEYDPASGIETLVDEHTWEVENERATIFLRRHRMPRLVDGPGIYAVRYFRADILLAEGYFVVE